MDSLDDLKFKNEDGTINFDLYFGEDDLVYDNFIDVKDHYLTNNSKIITDYKFDSAELVMGDIYKSKFDREFNDSMYEIKTQGYGYFADKIITDFDDDSTEADIKLNVNGLDHPVYIKYVNNLPGNSQDINIKSQFIKNEDNKIESKYVRVNDSGDDVYVIPNYNTMRIVIKDGKEIILIKGKDAGLEKELNSLLSSFKGNIKSFIPLMNNKLENNSITLDKFSKYSGYTVGDIFHSNKNWYKENKYNIAKRLGKRRYAS